VGAAREPRHLAERLLGDRIMALLEHEGGHAEEAELASRMADIVELLFHSVADEDQSLHLGALGLATGMRDNLADLSVTAAAIDFFHQARQPLGLRDPGRRPAFRKPAIIDK